ncbi:unnamed protein product [Cunninghamella blakesleeana]
MNSGYNLIFFSKIKAISLTIKQIAISKIIKIISYLAQVLLLISVLVSGQDPQPRNILVGRCKNKDYQNAFPKLITDPGTRTVCSYYPSEGMFLPSLLQVNGDYVKVIVPNLGFMDYQVVSMPDGVRILRVINSPSPVMTGLYVFASNIKYEESKKVNQTKPALVNYEVLGNCNNGEYVNSAVYFETANLTLEEIATIEMTYDIKVDLVKLQECISKKYTVLPDPNAQI